jgi:anti-sigma regulatory factor (Ser/Thr protein kinase)
MESLSIAVADPSHVSAARQGGQRLAHALEFDTTRAGRLAIAVTEATTNMLKHAGGGTLAARTLARGDAVGIEVLAIDRGPGMENFRDSARDGVSTTGTAGTGLGAMQRQSDEFDVYTLPSQGTIVRMVFWNRKPAPVPEHYEIGAICIPKTGENVCGDAWGMETHAQGATFLVADGLGHGPDACRAASSAVQVLHANAGRSAVRILDLAHGSLRATRGAAVAVIRHDADRGEIAFAGVGNVAACIFEGASRRAMISHNGIVGHNVHKAEEYRYPWPPGALLIAHTDGLETQWSLSAFPGLTGHHPSLIAAMLFREHSRKRDDVTVFVARATPH